MNNKLTQIDIISNAPHLSIEEIMQYELSDFAILSIEKIKWEDIIKYKQKISPKIFFEKAEIPFEQMLDNNVVISGVSYTLDKLPTHRLRHLYLIDYNLMLEFIDIPKNNTKLIECLSIFFNSNFFKKYDLIKNDKLVDSFEKNKNVDASLKELFKNTMSKLSIKATSEARIL